MLPGGVSDNKRRGVGEPNQVFPCPLRLMLGVGIEAPNNDACIGFSFVRLGNPPDGVAAPK